ncbi:MAG: hypothetical protein KatS3mg033_1189 [Thermonema sp.]|uniref:hypothetical protein n=1 Tax=Thermonema sp. TaxID=2231181 RepID=UPI0021DCDA5D|nr:hypothetical protein [Thermonema sp.]GIV39389.1 MAG: hypothetical protein KatS3mg033_1189 [Thermonema sp.]
MTRSYVTPQDDLIKELQNRLGWSATVKSSRGKLWVIPSKQNSSERYGKYVELAPNLYSEYELLERLRTIGIEAKVSLRSRGFALEDVHCLPYTYKEVEGFDGYEKVPDYPRSKLQLHSDVQTFLSVPERLEQQKVPIRIKRQSLYSYHIELKRGFDATTYDVVKDMAWRYLNPGKKIRHLYAFLKHLEASGIPGTVKLLNSSGIMVKLMLPEEQELSENPSALSLSENITTVFEALQRMEQMQIPLNIDIVNSRTYLLDRPKLPVQQLTKNVLLEWHILVGMELYERLKKVGIEANVIKHSEQELELTRLSLKDKDSVYGQMDDSAWLQRRQTLIALAKRLDAAGVKGLLAYRRGYEGPYFQLRDIDYDHMPVKPFTLHYVKTESDTTSTAIKVCQQYYMMQQLLERARVSAHIRCISSDKFKLTNVKILEDPQESVSVELPESEKHIRHFLLRIEAARLHCMLRKYGSTWQVDDLSIPPEAEEWLPQSLEEEARQLLFLADRLENAACSARLSLKMKPGKKVILISEIELPPGQAKGQVKLEGNFQLLKDFLAFMKAQRIQARLWVRDYGILLSELIIEGLDTSTLDDQLVAQALVKRLKAAGWRGKLGIQGKGVFVLQNLQRLQEE